MLNEFVVVRRALLRGNVASDLSQIAKIVLLIFYLNIPYRENPALLHLAASNFMHCIINFTFIVSVNLTVCVENCCEMLVEKRLPYKACLTL